MKESYEWVSVKVSNPDRFFLKCHEKNIAIYEIQRMDNEVKIKIQTKDYSKLKQIWFIKIKKIEPIGIHALKKKIQKHHIFLIAIGIGLVFLYVLSHIMLSVTVVHSNQDIRFLLMNALEEKGIKENTWRKSYQEIEKIKQEILDQYPDQLEWLEIEVNGLNYIVRVEERKLEQEDLTPEACNVVATKDGIVKEMVYMNGEAMFKRNDSVKKGDILISGTIKKDEETKSTVCATGSVYAEVWYTVKASVPLSYEECELTGKTRWNIKLKNTSYHDFLFKSRLETYDEEITPLFTLFGTEVSFVKQHETVKKVFTMEENEAADKALTLALEKISATLEEKETIIAKKVLKKEVNNSTMNIEVFVSVLEQIGERQEFTVEE